MNIAKYTASIGFKVDTQDIRKVDRALSLVENKMKAFQSRLSKSLSLNLTRFTVDQKRLNTTLGNALDAASPRVAFEVSRFVVNDRALLAALLRAARRLPPAPPGPNPPGPGPHPPAPPGPGQRGSRRTSAGLGGIGLGLMGPLGYGALALAGGGYGLGALNRRNQEVVSAQLQTSAVAQQALGDSYTPQAGNQSFQWLRNQAQETGFNYLEAVPNYNKLVSGIVGAGGTLQQGQGIFKGFSELSRVYKLGQVQQNRLFKGLSDVAGKDQLMSEELTGQLAEVLPGAVSLFAEAYQRQIGGNLTGSAATKALRAAMKDRKVTGSILTVAGDLAAERAAPNLEPAKRASQAEQARYQNTITDLAVVASNAGVEEGFARIFRTLNAGLSESNGLVEGLAFGFNEATKWADDLILFPQDFIRAIEGKDSLVADWLGIEKTKQLQEDWKTIKQIFTDISNIKFEFLPNLESTAREIASIMESVAWAKNLLSGNLPTERVDYNNVEKIDPFGAGAYTSPWELAKAAGNNFLVGLSEYGDRKERMSAINDPNSIYYNDPDGYDAMQKDRAMTSQEDSVRNAMITNQIQIQLNVDAVTLGQMNIEAQADLLTQRLAIGLEQVMVNFPQKE